MKGNELTRGDLTGVGRADKRRREALLNWQKSAEAIVPAGCGREGPNIEQGSDTVSSQETRSMQNSLKGTCPLEAAVKPQGPTGGHSVSSAQPDAHFRGLAEQPLMELVIDPRNILAALKRVRSNGGAPGVDGMTVEELQAFVGPYLDGPWLAVRRQLLEGTYIPMPVRWCEIPKPDGGVRMLGIPTALDRLIQQAIQQVLTPIFDPEFSDASYGFRPGRRAHDAVERARSYVAEGYTWVVDIDVEKFFDRVNHDILMARVARRVTDKRLLKLIRRFLEAGVMVDGVTLAREEGTPQGGPLSPLLANILLDDLDRELTKRGHRFVRYADDCNIYVRSRRAGIRVMASVQRFLQGKLRLKLNEAKSKVDKAWRCTFLSFSMYTAKGGPRIRIAPKAVKRLKEAVRQVTDRNRSMPMADRIRRLNELMRGWIAYFVIADAKKLITELQGWIRRRLRACVWKQWKRVRTRIREMRALGFADWKVFGWANDRRGPWAIAGTTLNSVLPSTYWIGQGLVDFVQFYQTRRQTQ